ncbi:MAG TPA: hypothetical protein VFA12_07735 [Stellaceae bacterium]|nr:hypothetical protein [Stellaceae bacterium]
MRKLRTALRIGVAAMSLAGFCGVATAQSQRTHVLTVRLPDGSLEQIRYAGNTPPRVVFSTEPLPLDIAMPAPMFGAFAQLDRIAAEMDRQAAALMRQAETLAAQPAAASTLTVGTLPPGSASYSMVTTVLGNGVCTRSVEITSQGNGAPPRVVSHSSGNCGAGSGGSAVSLPPAPAPRRGPDVIMTKARAPQRYAGLVRNAAYQR